MTRHYLNASVHLIWAVFDRQPILTADIRAWLVPHIAESARRLGAIRVVVGAVADHVHVAMDLPATESIANVAKRLKGASSRQLNMNGIEGFRWQEGYGAVTISPSAWSATAAYVRDQEVHHAANQTDANLERDLWEGETSIP